MFKLHFNDHNLSFDLLKQDILLLIKLLKYQIDSHDRDTEKNVTSIFGNDFELSQFVEEVIAYKADKEEYYVIMLYLSS